MVTVRALVRGTAAAGTDGLTTVRSFPDPALVALVLTSLAAFSNPRRRGFLWGQPRFLTLGRYWAALMPSAAFASRSPSSVRRRDSCRR